MNVISGGAARLGLAIVLLAGLACGCGSEARRGLTEGPDPTTVGPLDEGTTPSATPDIAAVDAPAEDAVTDPPTPDYGVAEAEDAVVEDAEDAAAVDAGCALVCGASCCPPGASCSELGFCVRDGMVEVPAGSFWRGCNEVVDLNCETHEHPYHPVFLDAFEIDLTEVTVTAYGECVDAGVCSTPGSGDLCNWGKASRQDHPINCVPSASATAFCDWAGKRLCSEAEWEKAARGGCELYPGEPCETAMPVYPWGNEAATCALANLAFECGNGTWPVASASSGVSPYGVFDLSGNVLEWTADGYAADAYLSCWDGCSNPSVPFADASYVVRGGSFDWGGIDAGRASWREDFVPEHSCMGLGFRCCR